MNKGVLPDGIEFASVTLLSGHEASSFWRVTVAACPAIFLASSWNWKM
jgi:hypothetical protein